MVQSPSRRRHRFGFTRSLALLSAAAGASLSTHAWAASGTWTNTAGGNWNLAETANWSGGTVADGADSTADFSTIDILGDRTVVLTENRTIGNMVFGDSNTATAGSWIISGGVLTLSTTTGAPQITANTLGTGKAVFITSDIAGTNGFTKAGITQLVLSGTASTYTGVTNVNRGTLTWANSGSINTVTNGSVMVNASGAVNYSLGMTDATFLSKINTASVGALGLTTADAATNFDFTSGTLATLGNMSIGAVRNNTVIYTGTITPAANTYRLGGGGGTLQVNSNLTGGSNNLVVQGSDTTVILNYTGSTYGGTTTINSGATLQAGVNTANLPIGTGQIINNGTLTLNRSGNYNFNFDITGSTSSTLQLAAGSVTNTAVVNYPGALTLNIAPGVSPQPTWTVSTQPATFGGIVTLATPSGSTSARFVVNGSNAAFNGGIQLSTASTGNDNAALQVLGGTVTGSFIRINRSRNYGAAAGGPTASTLVSGGADTNTGVYMSSGSISTTGDLSIGTGNASGSYRQDGGNATFGGNLIAGAQTATNRWNILDVNGGTLNVNGSGGIVIGMDTTDHTENTEFIQRAGTTNTTGISFGDIIGSTNPGLTGGQGFMVVSGGSLYVGSGGMVKRGQSGFTARATFSGGIYGASADSSSNVDVVLATTNYPIQAADNSAVAHDITFNGAISGTGSFNKTGGGSLTLTNVNNNYSGNPTVSAGTLIGNGLSLRNTIANAAALVFDQSSTNTFTGAITGSGTVAKSSSGTLYFGSPQTYTGPTTVSGGTLRMSGAQSSTLVTVGNGATLGVNSGNLTLNALSLGTIASDTETLSVNDGSGIRTINVTNNNGLFTTGSQTTTVDIGSTGLVVGTYVLVDYSGSIQGSGYGGFKLGSLPPRMIASLVNNTGNTSVDLNIQGIDFPRWEGTNGTNPTYWDIATTANWREQTSGNLTTYLESTTPHDQVLFTDAAAGTTNVDITTTVTPSGVTITNNTKNYTFQSTGKISGTTFLLKQGTGTLTMSNTGGNDYSGNTTINAGTIALGADNVLSDNSTIVISGGTLDITSHSDLAGPVILNSGSINGSGGSLSAASFDVRSGTINATLSGTSGLTKTAGGTVTLNTAANYAGNTTIAEGTLRLGANDAIPFSNPLPTPAPGLVIGQGATSGTLDMNGFSQQVDHLSTAGTGTANTIVNNVSGPAAVLKIIGTTSAADTTYNGAINGNIALLHDSTRTLTLGGSNNTYTGGTTIDNLGVLVFNGDGALGAVPGVSTQNIIFNNNGGRLTAGLNLGVFSLAATRDIFIDFGVTATLDSGGNANTWTIPGVISGGGHLSKAGNGTLILTNSANSYGGNTSITAGNLRITSPTAISANPITIGVGSLQLDSGVSISNAITSTSSSADNMIDSVGTGGTATYAGVVTFGTGAQLRMAATGTGATLIFAGSASSGNSFVANQGNIIMVGSSSITASQGLLARPGGAATLAFTLRDSSTFTATTFTNLGNARNVSDVSLTLQDNATYTTGTTFTLLDTTAATATSTVNLNGTSTLTSGNFLKTSNGATQSSTINFNGGTLKVNGTSNSYMPALTNLTVNVNANATIDSNGFDVVIAQPFTAAGTGGLIKNGVGNLTMSGANTWVGNTTVNAGRLILGNSLTTSASVSVNNDAVLEIAPTGTGTRVIKTGPVAIASLAKINLQDNKLITTSPVGSWTGSNYTGITGAIATGRGTGNLWDGTTGIVTGQTQAIGSNYTSIGVAKASDVRPSTATATALWAGQTITGTDTLVMYTYGGDATLDGKINIDDYVKIDTGIAGGLTGWSNGDFNYDGKVNIDDYTTVIDANIGNQTGTFFASGGVSGSSGPIGVTAVPEPSAAAIVVLSTLLANTRRRRKIRPKLKD